MKPTPTSSVPSGLSSILGAPGVESDPVPELRPSRTPRAPRFAVRVPLRYRFPAIGEGNSGEWYSGETENISESGVAFQTGLSDADFATVPASDDGVRIEVVLPIPGAEEHHEGALTWQCTLVRVARGLSLGAQTHVAARLRN